MASTWQLDIPMAWIPSLPLGFPSPATQGSLLVSPAGWKHIGPGPSEAQVLILGSSNPGIALIQTNLGFSEAHLSLRPQAHLPGSSILTNVFPFCVVLEADWRDTMASLTSFPFGFPL